MTLRLIIEPIVRAALLEDLGRAGDITTDAIVPEEAEVEAVDRRAPAGRRRRARRRASRLRADRPDIADRARCAPMATRVSRGETVARIAGRARGVLAAERTALNLLSRMSGVATATRALADAIAGTKAKIVCTRKTTPGPARPRKGGGAARRRRQPPLRPRRRDADQGQPHRAGRRRAHRARTRAAPCRAPRQDRARGRHARPARRGARGRGRRRPARQHDARKPCAARWRWSTAAPSPKPRAASRSKPRPPSPPPVSI